jgi:hypothetical protein
MDYYEWCIDIRTNDNDYIRVRPPRQAEMSRWLATISLYCMPPPKSKKKQGLRRKKVDRTSPTHESSSPFEDGPLFELPPSRPTPLWFFDCSPPESPGPGQSVSAAKQTDVGALNHRPAKRRTLSFSRCHSHMSRSVEPVEAAPEVQLHRTAKPKRGGRLTSKATAQLPTGGGGTLGLRQLSFSRRRRNNRQATIDAQQPLPTPPVIQARHSMSEAGHGPTRAPSPDENPPQLQRQLKMRTMSWGRRHKKPKQEAVESSRSTERATGVVDVKQTVATPSDGSSEYSSRDQLEPATTVHPDRTIKRRAASFSLRRKKN